MKLKMHKHKLLLLMFSMLFSFSMTAQRQISGTVTDANTSETLIGASVLVKGTSTGTATDIDGQYTIMASEGDVLVFSYTGYSTQEVPLGASNIVNVTLSEGLTLEQVVVTGYSVDTRRSTPGSVSTVDSKDLLVVPSGNVEQQLQGRVSGVTVISNGQPGTASQVRVRGYGALGGNAPLYVVDGVSVNNTEFLSPDDIESTTVLKDATAASIYGSRAAGGVIVYTTKKGAKKNQPLQVTYNGMIGTTNPGSAPPIMNPRDQADWTWAAIKNAADAAGETPVYSHPQYGTGSTPTLPDYLLVGPDRAVSGSVNLADHADLYNVDPEAGGVYQVVKAATGDGTNWYDAITRNAMIHRHNLGFSGGTEKGRFYVGLGMQNQEGILIHQDFSRYTFRINSEFDLLPGLRVGQNLQGTYRSADIIGDGAGTGSADDENVILTASRMPSIIPVYDEFGGYAGTAVGGFNNGRNPVANLDGGQNNRNWLTGYFGNVYLEAEPIENLTFRTSFGGNYGSFNNFSYTRRQYENSENNSAFGYNQGSGFFYDWLWTNTARYKMTLGESKLDLMIGQEGLSQGNGRNIFGSGINPFSQSTDFVGLNTVSGGVPGGSKFTPKNFASYFGRAKVDIMDKYIVSLVVRRDGVSVFSPDERYGIFPAISAAWRVSSESFMDGQSIFDDLKLRVGYGIMGNVNNVGTSNQFNLYGTSIGASSYDITGSNSSIVPGYYRTRIGNPLGTWEKAITANFGIDALMFDGKLDVGLEFWKKDTEDLLFQQPVTVQSGFFASSPFVNVGKMKNTGVDLTIINKGRINSDLSYEVTVTGGFLSNEIVELTEGITELPNRSSSYRGITPVLNQVGQPLSNFFGYEVLGIFADAGEVSSAPTQEGAAPGRFRFADLNSYDDNGNLTGVPDGKIDLADRTSLGNPIPDFTGGININLTYKNFGIDIYSYMSIGNEIYNVSKLFTDFYPLFPGAAISERAKDSWTTSNTGATIPIFENVSNFSTNTQSNSFYVEDGSYFRLQNLTLSYSIPSAMTEGWKMRDLKFTASVNNLFTITGYEGLDPSVGGAADTNFGIDVGNVPITRAWTFGVQAGF